MLESIKVGLGIPITESIIGIHRNQGFEEFGEIREETPLVLNQKTTTKPPPWRPVEILDHILLLEH